MPVDENPLNVVLCWHMHQPDYRGPDGSDYELPWVYLHALKDYSDMASHLEAHEGGRAVVNFAPVLLEQIEDYSLQVRRWLKNGKRISDPLLAALAGPDLSIDIEARKKLIRECLRANETHLIHRFEAFHDLVDIVNWAEQRQDAFGYLNDQFLVDLLVWYHLAWTGESIRQKDIRIASLEKKKRNFDLEDRRQLLSVIDETLTNLIGRYRNLAESGRIELSVTPYAHPIMPLFNGFQVARESAPEMELPEADDYPGGEERAKWHVHMGLESFGRHIVIRLVGCWSSEEAMSVVALGLLEGEVFCWVENGQM